MNQPIAWSATSGTNFHRKRDTSGFGGNGHSGALRVLVSPGVQRVPAQVSPSPPEGRLRDLGARWAARNGPHSYAAQVWGQQEVGCLRWYATTIKAGTG
jgi:hypothetical protein